MSNFASDKLGAGTILWSPTERPNVAPDGTMYWDVVTEQLFIKQFGVWDALSTLAGGAPLNSPAFTGIPTAPTAAPLTDTIQIATTAYTDLAVGVETTRATTAEGLLAPKGSPTFTGTVTIPILTVTTSETIPSISINGGTALTAQTGTGGTLVTSIGPALTGAPTAPTATLGTNTTQIATTAFVLANAGGTTLIASGTAVLGTANIATLSSAPPVTVAGAGIATTDSIEWAFNAAPGSGYSGAATSQLQILAYVTSGNVNFLVVNPTAGTVTPPAATLNWRVIR